MPDYRRRYMAGGTYFFTVCLADRRATLLTDHATALLASWRAVARARPFRTVAYVVLPDHIHCMWRLPEGDRDFSTRWRLLKWRFSRAVEPADDPSRGRRPGERGIWQRRFWEHLVRDDADYETHLGYIHENPVRHGLARTKDDWPYSSWPRFKAKLEWRDDEYRGAFGEP